MKIHIIKVETCRDFEEDNYTAGAYFSEKHAKQKFNELVAEAKKNADDDTRISIDSNTRFESYGKESHAKDHYNIFLETVIVATGSSRTERLDTLANMRDFLKTELKSNAIAEIFVILSNLDVKELDFSFLTDTSEQPGYLNRDEAMENRIGITRWGKYGETWKVYPIAVRKLQKGLEFTCLSIDDERDNCTLHSNEIEDEELYRTACMLLHYLEAPEENNIRVTYPKEYPAGIAKIEPKN